MELTNFPKRTQYGLRAAIQLARRWQQGYVQSRDLAAEEDLPTKFLEQVLLILRRGGLLESKVGSGGGYRLKRPPTEIRVDELLRTLDTGDEDEPVDRRTIGGAAVAILRSRLAGAYDTALDQLTLAELAERAAKETGSEPQMYYI